MCVHNVTFKAPFPQYHKYTYFKLFLCKCGGDLHSEWFGYKLCRKFQSNEIWKSSQENIALFNDILGTLRYNYNFNIF